MKIDLNKYNDKSINELKGIKPHWAVEKNINFLLDNSINPLNGRYVIKTINTKALIYCSDFKNINLKRLFIGENSINDIRINRILYSWENKICLDPPIVGYNSHSKKIVFSDGRHRAKLSFFLEIKEIPIAVEKDDLEKIIQLLTTHM